MVLDSPVTEYTEHEPEAAVHLADGANLAHISSWARTASTPAYGPGSEPPRTPGITPGARSCPPGTSGPTAQPSRPGATVLAANTHYADFGHWMPTTAPAT